MSTENGKATMITEQLTSRQDLLELLDTEPVYDYLIQHGVLDKEKLDGICSEDTKPEQTKALLQHLEANSNSAVIGLFINALRQSGQLHLASLLDTDQKIKPTYGSGYLGKQRHKGQVAIEIVLEAVKVPKEVEPETEEEPEPEPEPKLTQSLQNIHTEISQYKLHKSYEDMTLLEGVDGAKPHRWRKGEYSYDFDEPDEDEKIKGSFWTMCLPIFCRGKSKHKQPKPTKHKNKKSKKKSNKKISTEPDQLESHTEKCKERKGKISPVMERTKKFPIQSSHSEIFSNTYISNPDMKYSKDSGEITVNIQSETLQHTDSNQNTPSHLTEINRVKYKNNLNNVKTKQNGTVTKCDNNAKIPPIIIITEPDDEKDKDTFQSDDPQDVTRNTDISEVWRSDGLVYEGHVEKLFSSLDVNIHDKIVKYFEQDRRTLVLQMHSERSLNICNICMSCDQVENLQKDYDSGKLLEDLEQILLTQEYIQKMHFLDTKIKVVIDKDEFELARQDVT